MRNPFRIINEMPAVFDKWGYQALDVYDDHVAPSLRKAVCVVFGHDWAPVAKVGSSRVEWHCRRCPTKG